MPGTHLVISRSPGSMDGSGPPGKALESLLHLAHYRADVVIEESGIFLGYTGYPEYPVRVHRNGGRILLVEGTVYDRSPSTLVSELTEITGHFLDGSNDTSSVCRWLEGTDGEFIVVSIDPRSGRFIVFNDPLGRLPLYRLDTRDRLIISREIRFIGKSSGWPRMDRTALAQSLMICFPLGDKTLYEGICHIPPGSIIAGQSPDPGSTESIRFYLDQKDPGNLESGGYDGRNMAEISEELARLFRQAISRRASGNRTNFLSLSGGLDSRAVLSGMIAEKTRFRAATYLEHYGTAQEDTRVAGLLADRLDFDWTLMKLPRPAGSDALKLLMMKSGANYLGMSYSLRFFDSIIDEFGGDAVFFSGEGGGQVLPDLRPARDFRSLRSLALFIIEENRIIPMEIVSKITGMDEEEILLSVIRALESYPEDDLRLKYVHFLVFERCLKWLSEGEDRNRCYFWTASPLLSTEFFNLAMSCPWNKKTRNRLYREFLARMSKDASRIEISGCNCPPSSPLFGLYLLCRDIYRHLPSGVRTAARKKLKKNFTTLGAYEAGSPTALCFSQQLNECDTVEDYLSVDEIRKNAGSLNKMGFDHLFTAVSVIEEITKGKSTLQKYSASPLL